MAHLHLPAEHSNADLVLAGSIAERIDSAELYVVWTPAGPALPEVVAELRTPAPHWTTTVALIVQVVRELVAALRGDDREAPFADAAGRSAAQPKPAA